MNVTDSGWKPLAMATAQLPRVEGFATTSLATGAGAVVRAGDLVKMRLGDGRRNGDGTPWMAQAWYWTGYLPAEFYHHGTTVPTALGSLLVGRHVGDRFQVERRDQAPFPAPVHLSAMAEPDQNRKGLGHMEAFNDASATWSQFSLRQATIEIIASCPASLSVRTGQMTQWGYIPHLFGRKYPTSRSGSLYWSAIDATCPAPDDPVRFMIGPIYFSPTSGTDQEAYRNETLANWQEAYRSARPIAKYPDEYQHVVIGGKWIHQDVRNQSVVDVAAPARHAAAPPGSGRFVDGAQSGKAAEPANARLEGYAWAMDNNIENAAECSLGSAEFIEGCKRAVAWKAAQPGR